MLRNRLCYVLVLISCIVFFLCYNGYLSYYVLIAAIFAPIFSLLLSLPSILTARVWLDLPLKVSPKGAQIPLRLQVSSKAPLAGGRARVLLTVRNTLTGDVQQERFSFSVDRSALTISHPLDPPYCGQLLLSLSKGRVCDYMGLFSLPLRISQQDRQRQLMVYPAVSHPALSVEQGMVPQGEGERYSQEKSGDDPSELYGFREYREGDRLSRIHWKLSQKSGDGLLVKEYGLPILDGIFFLLNLNGSGRETDAVLDAFATLSAFLCESGVPHGLAFRAGEQPDLTVIEILSPEDSRPALDALLSAGSGENRRTLPIRREELPAAASHVLYLCCAPMESDFSSLRERMPDARLSVLTPQTKWASRFVDSTQLVPLTPGHVEESLQGFVL